MCTQVAPQAATALFHTGLIDDPINSAIDPDDRLIVAGEEEHSAIVHRMAARNGYGRMPPLANSVVDETALNLLIDWIEYELPARKSYETWREENFGASPNGAPEFDADLDGRDNQEEFLAGTNPNVIDAAEGVAIVPHNGNVQITMPDLSERGQWLEVSSDLIEWDVREIPGNNGKARPAGQPLQVEINPDDDSFVFRSRIEER